MSTSTKFTSAYRQVVREVNKAAVAPPPKRNRVIVSNFRALFTPQRKEDEQQHFQHDIENAILFMKSQRMHKILLDRYNPLHDLTAQERVKATARRVGLNVPVTPPKDQE
ncbi:hypothetical protein ABKN59_000243 [Abortiporus biennis]